MKWFSLNLNRHHFTNKNLLSSEWSYDVEFFWSFLCEFLHKRVGRQWWCRYFSNFPMFLHNRLLTVFFVVVLDIHICCEVVFLEFDLIKKRKKEKQKKIVLKIKLTFWYMYVRWKFLKTMCQLECEKICTACEEQSDIILGTQKLTYTWGKKIFCYHS